MAGFVAWLPGHAEEERLAQSTPAFEWCICHPKEQESCAAAARSRPGRAGMAPGCSWNIVTVAGFVAASLLLIGRPRYFGGKIARIAALAFSHKLAAVSYNIRALGAPKVP